MSSKKVSKCKVELWQTGWGREYCNGAREGRDGRRKEGRVGEVSGWEGKKLKGRDVTCREGQMTKTKAKLQLLTKKSYGTNHCQSGSV